MGPLSTFFGRFVDGKANLLSIKKKVQKVVILPRRDGPNAAYRRSRFRDRISEPNKFFSHFGAYTLPPYYPDNYLDKMEGGRPCWFLSE